MIDKLIKLGFTEKEAKLYLLLLEVGVQPASVLAKKLALPRPTALFICETLYKKGFLSKSIRGRTQYYFANPEELEKVLTQEISKKQDTLEETVKLLKEYRNPLTEIPKLTFFEGLDGCRKAYSLLLSSKTEVREFSAHEDLEKMGKEFMDQFILNRAKNQVFMKDISIDSDLNRYFQNLDNEHFRKLKLFSPDIGSLYSSVAIFENKVLILNLYQDPYAILIENQAVFSTLKTIHDLIWSFL